MMTLLCLLEEKSSKEMLSVLLPKITSRKDINFILRAFEGKQDLQKKIGKRLKGWNVPNTRFLIMCDQDMGDCALIKNDLLEKAQNAGKQQVLVRIACCELESFYLGDLQAVEKGLNISGISKSQNKQKFRTPDQLAKPAQELIKLTNGQYQKVPGSRAIAQYLRLDEHNTSISFKNLVSGIEKLIE